MAITQSLDSFVGLALLGLICLSLSLFVSLHSFVSQSLECNNNNNRNENEVRFQVRCLGSKREPSCEQKIRISNFQKLLFCSFALSVRYFLKLNLHLIARLNRDNNNQRYTEREIGRIVISLSNRQTNVKKNQRDRERERRAVALLQALIHFKI